MKVPFYCEDEECDKPVRHFVDGHGYCDEHYRELGERNGCGLLAEAEPTRDEYSSG